MRPTTINSLVPEARGGPRDVYLPIPREITELGARFFMGTVSPASFPGV